MANNIAEITAPVIDAASLQHHWQEHRGLSRRTIEAFPEKELYSFSIGGMRPFAELAFEMLSLAEGGISGIATGDWTAGGVASASHPKEALPATKEALLARWDKVTADIDRLFPEIAPERWQEQEKAFGMYDGKIWTTTMYLVDNEIHHRGQGYVYLRALGIEPPPFWDRH